MAEEQRDSIDNLLAETQAAASDAGEFQVVWLPSTTSPNTVQQ